MTAIGSLKAGPARSSRQSEPRRRLVLPDQRAPATASYMGSAFAGAPITLELAGFCAAQWPEIAPPLTVEAFGVARGPLPLRPGWDAGTHTLSFQLVSQPVGIVPFVAEQPFRLRKITQQDEGATRIAHLAWRQEECQRAPPSVRHHVQLGV